MIGMNGAVWAQWVFMMRRVDRANDTIHAYMESL